MKTLPLLGAPLALLSLAALHTPSPVARLDQAASVANLPAADGRSIAHGTISGTLPAGAASPPSRHGRNDSFQFPSPMDRQWQETLEARLRKFARQRTFVDAVREFLESLERTATERPESLFGTEVEEAFFLDPAEVLARRQRTLRLSRRHYEAEASLAALQATVANPGARTEENAGQAQDAFGADPGLVPISIAHGVYSESSSTEAGAGSVTSDPGAVLPTGTAPLSAAPSGTWAGNFPASANVTPASSSSSAGASSPWPTFGADLPPVWNRGSFEPATSTATGSTTRTIVVGSHGRDPLLATALSTMPGAVSTGQTSLRDGGRAATTATAAGVTAAGAGSSAGVSGASFTVSSALVTTPVSSSGGNGGTAQPASTTPFAQAYAWGDNAYGQAGIGTSGGFVSTPTLMILPTSAVTGIAAGAGYNFVVDNGLVYGAGDNSQGELGIGSTAGPQTTPVAQATGFTNGANIIAAGGEYSGYAVTHNVPYGWGANGSFQVGNGTGGQTSIPQNMVGGTLGTTAISGGYGFGLLILNGAVYGWGTNANNQLTSSSSGSVLPAPTKLSGLGSGVTAISAGNNTSLAVMNGAVYTWGNGNATPTAVAGLGSGVTAVAAGSNFNLALMNGVVYAWGSNGNGQLGQGNILGEASPVAIPGIPGTVVSIAAGEDSGYALTSTGLLYAWGADNDNQLGDGSFNQEDSPIEIAAPAGMEWTTISANANGESVLAIAIPEPATGGLLAAAGMWLVGMIRKRARRK